MRYKRFSLDFKALLIYLWIVRRCIQPSVIKECYSLKVRYIIISTATLPDL